MIQVSEVPGLIGLHGDRGVGVGFKSLHKMMMMIWKKESSLSFF